MTQEIQYLHLLAGLVRCQPCGTEMTAIHDPDNRYVCPTLMERGPDDCTTPPIDAEYLDRLVATRLVENVLTGKNLQTVIKIIQEQSGEKSLRHRAELETISDRLAGQNRPRRELMAAVETERTPFAKVAGRVQELNDTKTRLEAQAIEAKKQLGDPFLGGVSAQAQHALSARADFQEHVLGHRMPSVLIPCKSSRVQSSIEESCKASTESPTASRYSSIPYSQVLRRPSEVFRGYLFTKG